MAKITVNEHTFEVPDDKRLVLAIEDNGIQILHRCGGYARCTTCRVKFVEGEPELMTRAEKTRLQQDPANLFGKIRLSCQILCDHDMTVEPVMTLQNTDVSDPGKRPEDQVTPTPEYVSRYG
ncbi:MAG: (2Fe-2S)-binding protein [Chloroflexi bacterium]|nr:(2Fe-2S)-binding protein [Chloroflexota bacterium]